MTPVVTYVGSFSPGKRPYPNDADYSRFGRYGDGDYGRTWFGNAIDFGSGYFGMPIGYSEPNDEWPLTTLTTPGYVQLWKMETTGPVFVSQVKFEVPTYLRFSNSSARRGCRTCVMSHAKLSATKVVATSNGQSGAQMWGVIIERVGETLVAGPLFFPCAHPDHPVNTAVEDNNLYDDDFTVTDGRDPEFWAFPQESSAGYATGSMIVQAPFGSDEFVVTATIGHYDVAETFGLATRQYTLSGLTATPVASWRVNPVTWPGFGQDQYAWIYGTATIGAMGYVLTWDWTVHWALHRINLSTGLAEQTVRIPMELDQLNGGVMTDTRDGLVVLIGDYTADGTHHFTYQPSDLALLATNPLATGGEDAEAEWDMSSNWQTIDFPVTGAAGCTPWLFSDWGGDVNGLYYKPFIALFDGTSFTKTQVVLPVDNLNIDWEGQVAVVKAAGDTFLLCGAPATFGYGNAWDTEADAIDKIGVFRIIGPALLAQTRAARLSFD